MKKQRKRRSDFGVQKKAPEEKKIQLSVTIKRENKDYLYNAGEKESGKKSLGHGIDKVVEEHREFTSSKN